MNEEQISGFLKRLLNVVEHGLDEDEAERLVAPEGDAVLSRIAVAVNRLVRQVGVTESSSEWRLAEAALRRRAKLLEESQRLAQIGSWELDVGTLEFSGTAEAFRIFNRSDVESPVLWSTVAEHVHPDDISPLLAHFARALKTGDYAELDYRVVQPDGVVRRARSNGELHYGEDGRVERIVGTVQDVTERVEALEALQRSEELLRESQEVARIGTYALDITAGTFDSSPMLDVVLGMPPNHPKTIEGWLALVHPNEREEMADYLMSHVIGSKQPFEREYRVQRLTDGEERWVYGVGRLQLDDEGNPVSMLGTIQDIDARKRAELSQTRLYAQLTHAQRMESVGRLAGGVAHDFNNMLTVIIGYASMLRGALVEEPDRLTDVMEIERAARQAQGLTRQLLAFSRHQVTETEQVDLNEVVEASRKTLVRLIGEHIILRADLAPGLWEIASDPSQMAQVLVNLAINARDAMPNGGQLHFETANVGLDASYSKANLGVEPGDFVRLTVTDTGVGMSAEVLDHIFEPFFTTKELGQGTGLGLSTVYGIVKQHGGFLDVESTVGVGTTFRVFLPRSRRSDSAAKVTPPLAPVSSSGTGNVLLVEDDELVRRVTAAMLRSGGFEVAVCSNPESALDYLQQEGVEVEVVVTDVVMPGMNGVELRRQVQALRPGTSVLFMSGYTANLLEDQGLSSEAANLLQKPFTRDDLISRVSDLMTGSQAQTPSSGSGLT